MKNIDVSVVMSVFNGAKMVSTAIDSIIRQSFQNWELIIINDCSKDNTRMILEQYRNNDKRIKIVNNNKNIGLIKFNIIL